MTRGATRRLNAMPHPNEELLRRGKEAFLRGDIDTVKELLADDFVLHTGMRSSGTSGW
jgi:ketosteroid isomerase-like protein